MGSRKSKQTTIGYWYRLGVQIAVAHAPVDKITQLLFGERTAWTGSVQDGNIQIDKKDLFGGDKREGGVAGTVSVHSGAENQPVNPYVAAMRGATSAQRGLLTLVFGTGGQAGRSQLRAINFNVSTMSESAEQALGYRPFGILTNASQDVSKEQAYSYIANFYPDITPYQEGEDEDRNGNGTKGEYVEPIEDQKKIYGSYRAVALMYAYRAFVLGNLIRNPKRRFTTSEFFANEARDSLIDRRYTQPFYWCAMNPYFKAVWVRVQSILNGWTGGVWYAEKAVIAGTDHIADNNARIPCNDMNPAHIIYKILTNATWGMGYNPSDLDDTSFKKAADKLYEERFGLSIAWRNEETIEDFIGKILDTIDGALRINVITGKFELLLIRNDYKLEDLPVLDEDCIIEVSNFERSSWGDSPNEVVLTYKDRNEESAVVTVQNLSAIEVQGGVISSTQTYEAIHEAELAARVAQRELQALSTPLAKINLKVNRMAFLLQHGDVFNLKWEALGIAGIPCRVMSITRGEFDDGTITIEAVEDVFGMPMQTYVSGQGSLWTDTNPRTPLPVTNMRIWETPYYDVVASAGEQTVAQSGMTEGNTFTRILADAPSEAAMNFDLWASSVDSANSYRLIGNGESFTSNFQLADRVSRTDTTIKVAYIENNPTEITDTMYIVVDDEIMAIQSIDERNGVINVRRGALDTIPETHTAGTIGWITDAQTATDETFRAQGETVYYRALTNTLRGKLPFAESTSFRATLVGRPYRPFPPANVYINSNNQFPAVLPKTEPLRLSWAGRNRKTANLSTDWQTSHITPESGVTYNIRIYDPITGKEFYNDTNITAFSKQYAVPVSMYKFTLPTSISGLVYHYDFENGLTPVAGSNTAAIAASNTTFVQGALVGSMAIKAANNGFMRLPFDEAMNAHSFAFGLRFKPTSAIQRLYMLQNNDKKTRMEIWQQNATVYLTYRFFSLYTHIATTPLGVVNEFCDLLVNVNHKERFADIWVNGIRKLRKQLPTLYKMVDYDHAGDENLYLESRAVEGYVNDSGTIGSDGAHNKTSDFIPVEAGQTYVWQVWRRTGGSGTWNGYVYYDADKHMIGSRTRLYESTQQGDMLYSKIILTPPAGAAYIRIASDEILDGRVMFTKGSDVPAYNRARDDIIGVKITDGAYIGKSEGDGSTYYDSDTTVDDVFLYNRALTDSEVTELNSAMVKQAWSERVAIEMYSARGNIKSWQTFKHSWKTQ